MANDVLFNIMANFLTCLWNDEFYDVMTYFWRYDEISDIKTYLRHDELFYVMTYFWRYDELSDVMTYFEPNFATSWHIFDIMKNFLTPFTFRPTVAYTISYSGVRATNFVGFGLINCLQPNS